MKATKDIEAKIGMLSPGLMGELNHYLDYLIKKKSINMSKKLQQNWAGGLKDIKFSALELQKKALEWRQK